jgi:RNase H-like domain found in reverse transcriptase
MPTDAGQLVLDTDASDVTIKAVLQEGVEQVIVYASRTLDKRECNYCVMRKELLAVVHFMKYFRQHLLGHEFKMRTDHAALHTVTHRSTSTLVRANGRIRT